MFNVNSIREEFPILSKKFGKYPLVYFDNGATSQKPNFVIDRIDQYYKEENANIHRGVHTLSQVSTENYENARQTIASFLNAKEKHEIIFTKGTTDGINLVAHSFGALMSLGDEILISEMEHHSNIVPWQMLAEAKGLVLRYIPMTTSGELDLKNIDTLLNEKTKLVAITHISNSLGTINPIADLIELAHSKNAKVLIDGAQSLQHIQVDVQALDCDFLVFSGHKIFAPTGTGILYGKEDLLNKMPPYQGGGDMIKTVTMEKTTFNSLPHKFEAGTPNISGGIGLGAAIEWLSQLNLNEIEVYERSLLQYITAELSKIEGIRFFGTAEEKCSTVSFLIGEFHPYDIGTLLNQQGIAVRTGHHCTQPIMDFYKIPGTIRASLSFYNTKEEIDLFIQALNKAIKMLS
ncbi:aminotransferase class V-fold PLP-dependent enzyme [Crocinitomix catalasitica]|uniref:aminotransferase class V-fold PLP-dependent enzyme n=1 Tax=Crocinitomix catalasitica TaxID=184607 RepID=UPI0004852C33|nr:cysteine desulfurase [Crocinitomix catalasitica]